MRWMLEKRQIRRIDLLEKCKDSYQETEGKTRKMILDLSVCMRNNFQIRLNIKSFTLNSNKC
jgi:hypothetical protein